MAKKTGDESGTLRGPKLIKKAIEAGRAEWLANPEPVATSVLKKLALPNGESISPAMKELLKVDALWLGLEFDEDEGDIEAVSLEEAVEDFFGDDGPALFGEACELFDGDCVPIGGASEALRVLYVGEADESGEYAVLTLVKDPEPWVTLAPFDVWVAQALGALPASSLRGEVPPSYGAAAKELAEATGDGRVDFAPSASERSDDEEDEDEGDEADDDEADSDHEDEEDAADADEDADEAADRDGDLRVNRG